MPVTFMKCRGSTVSRSEVSTTWPAVKNWLTVSTIRRFWPTRGQRLVDEAVGPAREAHQQVVGGAEAAQRERPAGQRMVVAHHAGVLAVVQALVAERGPVAGLRLRRQVGQHRREEADRQVHGAVVEQRGADRGW